MNTPTEPLALLEKARDKMPDKEALTFFAGAGATPIRFTAKEVVDRCTDTAAMLKGLGHGSNDVAAFLLPNVPQAHWLLWGGQRACRIAPINPLLRPNAIVDLLTRLEAKTLFAFGPTIDFPLLKAALAARNAVPSLERVVRVGGNPSEGGEAENFATLVADYEGSVIEPRDPSDVSALFHTGGTTAAPKIAGLTGQNQVVAAKGIATQLGYGDGDVVCAPLPLFHIAGAVVAGLAPMARSARVIMPGPSGFRDLEMAKSAWTLVEQEKATILAAVPTSLGALTGVPVDADISTLEYVLTGTATMPVPLAERVEAHLSVPVLEGYGMTEAAGGISFAARDEAVRHGSVGRPIDNLEVRIGRVEAGEVTSTPVADGSEGAVLLKGGNVFGGYLNEPDRGFLDGGWFDTGDLGRLDFDGCLSLTGRSKDLIIRSGHNLDPAAIESAALTHPDVLQAAAVSAPDQHAGEVPALFVECRKGAKIDAEELTQYMADAVEEAPAKPRFTIVLSEMPLTSVGKIFKPELRRRAAEMWLKDIGMPAKIILKPDGSLSYAVTEDKVETLRAAVYPLSLDIIELELT